jgi:hypothetical protein
MAVKDACLFGKKKFGRLPLQLFPSILFAFAFAQTS